MNDKPRDILCELTEIRRRDAEMREAEIPFREMVERAASAPPPRDFAAAFGGDGLRIVVDNDNRTSSSEAKST